MPHENASFEKPRDGTPGSQTGDQDDAQVNGRIVPHGNGRSEAGADTGGTSAHYETEIRTKKAYPDQKPDIVS
jgi:hypothetical protein